jgi:YVTN family beta-propeller protein
MKRRAFLAGAMAAAPVLAGGRVPTAWGGGRDPLALVTADKEAHLVAVSLVSGEIRKRIGTRGDPRAIECRGLGPAVVAHSAEGVVSLVDGSDLRVRRVLGGFVHPRYPAISRDGKFAYVTDSGSGELAVIDLVTGRVVRRIVVGARARHLTISPDGSALWVSLGSSASELVVVHLGDPRRPVIARTVRPPFLAHDVVFSPSGRRIWVTAGRERRIAVFATAGAAPLRTLDADAAPQHVAFLAGRAYVASGDGGSVRVHRLSDGATLRAVKVPFGSYNVVASAGVVVTPSLATGSLTVLDRNGRERTRVRVASAAHDVCIVA